MCIFSYVIHILIKYQQCRSIILSRKIECQACHKYFTHMVSFIPYNIVWADINTVFIFTWKHWATQDEATVKSQGSGHQWQDPNRVNLILEPEPPRWTHCSRINEIKIFVFSWRLHVSREYRKSANKEQSNRIMTISGEGRKQRDQRASAVGKWGWQLTEA